MTIQYHGPTGNVNDPSAGLGAAFGVAQLAVWDAAVAARKAAKRGRR